ncbi:MAG: PQQ-binding-like beta-propeller repeat protein [Fuerstiella sp.]|nr:PQQ-binding-like beta-propeller repeat protein [Fuerstiella sp.]MCP4856822.1 PQQ-binding-like beta-propeller repeat protein [Fuerstiella sp.]
MTIVASAELLGVIPVLVGPLQALLVILPGVLVAIAGLLITLFKPSTVKRFLQLLWSQKLVVLPVLLLVVAASWIFPMLKALAIPATALDVDAASEGQWPVWRGGPERRGAVLDVADPAHGNVVWSFAQNGINDFYCSPAVVGNRVYATSARWELFRKDGAIYSLDADTGKLVWAFDSEGYRATFSSPEIYFDEATRKRYLVVGEGLHLTNDARVFCLDIDASEEEREGVVHWSYRTNSHVESSPCVADGKVFIGAGDDGLYGFDLQQKDKTAEPLWHLHGDRYADCETSPVYDKASEDESGRVYFGLGIGGQAVVCVDAQTGDEHWRVDTPYPVFGCPAISNGKLFFGMGHGDFVNTAEQVAANLRVQLKDAGKSDAQIGREVDGIRPVGEVWCVDLATHQVDWKFPVGRVVLGAVAVDGDWIYFGSRDEHLYAVNIDGRTSRRWNAQASLVTSPAVAREHVYAVTQTGHLYGLDKRTMSPVWDVALNAPSFSSPTVARGHVYVGSTGNGLLCLGKPGREQTDPLWAGALGGAGKSGWTDESMLPKRGSYAWGYLGQPDEEGEKPPPPAIHSPAAYLGGVFYVGLNRPNSCGLARLDAEQDSEEESADHRLASNRAGGKLTQRWFVPSTNAVNTSAAASGNAVFFVDGTVGDSNRLLHQLNAETGSQLWTRPVATGASGEFVITRDRLFVADTDSGLTCLKFGTDTQTEEIWHANVGRIVGQPAIMDNMVAVTVRSPAQLVVLDRWSGEQLLAVPLVSDPRTEPVIMGNQIWFGAADGARCYDLARGRMEPTIDTGPIATRLVGATDRLACVNEAGELVVIMLEPTADAFDDHRSVETIHRTPNALTSVPPLLTDDAVLFAAKDSLRYYDLGTQEDSQWARIRASFPGQLTTPMIVADSHVFFATDKRGLVCMKPKN